MASFLYYERALGITGLESRAWNNGLARAPQAFDLDADGRIDFREFVLGMVAMDRATPHDGLWAEVRRGAGARASRSAELDTRHPKPLL